MSSRRAGATRRRTCGCCRSRTPRRTAPKPRRPTPTRIRAHLERRGWTQDELAARSSLKLNTVGAVLRGDPTSTRTLTAIAAGFGVGVAALFDGGAPERADHWTAALEHLNAAGRTVAAANVDAPPRPELTPDAAADVERAALAVHRALEANRRGRGGSPGRAGAVRVRPGRGTRRILGWVSGPATRLYRKRHPVPG